MCRAAIAILLAAACLTAAPKTTKIVLVAGHPSHGPGEHEFNAGVMLLDKMLRQTKGVETVIVKNNWPQDESVFEGAAAIVFYMNGGDKHPITLDNRLALLQKYVDKGVGIACLHYAVEVPKDKGGPELLKWIGGYYERPYSTNPVNDVLVTQAAPAHPISNGWKSFEIKDEWYYRIRFDPADKSVTPILTTMLPKDNPNQETIAWTKERPDGGRGFGFTGGHYHVNWANQDFRQMLVNAVLWTAKVKIPKSGAPCKLEPGEIEKNLDPKPGRKT